MATAGLLALLDDITTLLDDVAMMTKVASKKTAAVVGDDLALNANQLTGLNPSRELPVVAAVAKGSLVNKAILIPTALLITAVAPWLIAPLLMIGGTFLCYEGAEKIFHRLLDPEDLGKEDAVTATTTDPLELERQRVRGAVFTDFILSAEIMVIALGAAAGGTLAVQALTLIAIGIGMTVIVYGTVALVVKADDVGVHLLASDSAIRRAIGRGILAGAPLFMKALSVLGTAAMFLVGGEIVAHGVPFIEHTIASGASAVGSVSPVLQGFTKGVAKIVGILLFGLVLGVICIVLKKGVKKLLAAVR